MPFNVFLDRWPLTRQLGLELLWLLCMGFYLLSSIIYNSIFNRIQRAYLQLHKETFLIIPNKNINLIHRDAALHSKNIFWYLSPNIKLYNNPLATQFPPLQWPLELEKQVMYGASGSNFPLLFSLPLFTIITGAAHFACSRACRWQSVSENKLQFSHLISISIGLESVRTLCVGVG